MKFRRKVNTEIDAEQYIAGVPDPRGVMRDQSYMGGVPYVVTIHRQKCLIEIGDWIVLEPDGEHYYPIKDYVFKATYELVGDE